jgi:hypothetical protein
LARCSVAVDGNAIDDDRLINKMKSLLQSKDPSSIHHQLKEISQFKYKAEDEIRILKKKVQSQNHTLNKYRDKLSNHVVASVEGSKKGGQKSMKKMKKKKGIGIHVKRKKRKKKGGKD